MDTWNTYALIVLMVGGGFINTQVFGLAWYETYQYNAPKVYALSDDGQQEFLQIFSVLIVYFLQQIFICLNSFLKLEKCGLLENMNT